MKGVFYGIGVGPGDPELLTVKAIRAIEKADVLIAPKTEKKEGSLALSIVGPYVKEGTEVVCQVFPMVKDFADSTVAWEQNKGEILRCLEDGKSVAFLTLGDPMFFSTYIYIYRLLEREGVQIETIPGIPAFTAIGCHIGYPIVEGNEVLAVIPATAEPQKIEQTLRCADNVVLMKVYKNFPEIADMLSRHGMAKQAVMVSRCGLPNERRIDDIEAHKDEPVNYLSTILSRKNTGGESR